MGETAALPTALVDEERRKTLRPVVQPSQAVELAEKLFGLKVDADPTKLDSYDDVNYRLRVGDASYVFKVHNGVESENEPFIRAQNEAMCLVKASATWCPTPLTSKSGKLIERAMLQLASGESFDHAVRCLPFLPAKLLADVPLTEPTMRSVGEMLARVDVALSPMEDAATMRAHMWDLRATAQLSPLVELLPAERKVVVVQVLSEFEKAVAPLDGDLRRQVIHADANDQNVLINETDGTVAGIIDFGDMVHTWLVNELAIACAYVLVILQYETKPSGGPDGAHSTPQSSSTSPSPELAVLKPLVDAYTQQLPLKEEEWTVLPTLIACRLAMSLAIGNFSAAKDPTNDYLRLTLQPGWRALTDWRRSSAAEWTNALRGAT